MRGDPAAHRLVRAASLQQALDLLAEKGWHPLAGGTDVMVLFAAGTLAWPKLVDIRSLPDLRGISVTADHVTLGALTTYTEVQRDQVLQREFPMLCQAASSVGNAPPLSCADIRNWAAICFWLFMQVD
jgi:CO/xanthine dehydrogenase FAD-binding subunit